MNTSFRFFSSILILFMIFLLVGCDNTGNEEKDNISLVPFPMAQDYVIMRAEFADEKETAAAITLGKYLKESFGRDFVLTTDWVKRGETVPESGREILIGETNRPQSITALSDLRQNDFTIRIAGERILILGGSPSATETAVAWFCEHCIDSENQILMLPEGENGFLYTAVYPVERIVLQGHDVKEYQIVSDLKPQTKEGYAIINLAKRISELCGVYPDIVDPELADAPCSIRILSTPAGDVGTYTITGEDGSVMIAGNGDDQLLLGINDFLYENFPAISELSSAVKAESGEKILSVSLNGKTVRNQITPLISFNLPDTYKAMNISAAEDGGVMEAFNQAIAELPEEVTVQNRISPEDYPRSMRNQIWVSPDGDDSAAGTEQAPLATIQAGLDRLAGMSGGVIWLRGGNYQQDGTLSITEIHSGTDASPLFISAWNNEKPVLTAGISISKEDFVQVTDHDILTRLKPDIADKVLVCDLFALGYQKNDLGSFETGSRPGFFVNGIAQTLARYPNVEDGEILMGEVIEVGKVSSAHSALYAENSEKTCGWTIRLDDPTPYTWQDTQNLWIFGSVYAEWERLHYPVTLDAGTKTVTSSVSATYGALQKSDNYYFFYNVLEALDVPGEWYLDSKAGKLYYYPDGDMKDMSLVTSKDPVVSVSQASCVVFNGLTVTGTMQKGVEITDGYEVISEDCTFFGNGTNGLVIRAGEKNGVMYSLFYANGAAQAVLGSGNRAVLKPDYNFIQNCVFRDGVEQTGTNTSGVGSVISHNLYDGAIATVSPSNECILEYNEFVHGSLTTADAGMIYMIGCDLSSRGNHIRYNYLHDMAASHAGVYIDDCASGQYVYGNIVDVKNSELDAAFNGKMTYRLHNGRECVFWNNITIGATNSAFADNANYYAQTSVRWPAIRESVLSNGADKVSNSAFAARYPIFTTYYESMQKHAQETEVPGYTRNALEDLLREPAWNIYKNNIIIDAKTAFNISEVGLKTADGLDCNLISKNNPLNERYQIPENSDIWNTMPEYRNVPYDKMGLCEK
ncbi:MAG: right-handed parallel beta-helix repeat-containing protein [Clostridia bacterium]|nr:right-handed parallel beta-helix repeat-containing protein [Clostridia bacterium]